MNDLPLDISSSEVHELIESETDDLLLLDCRNQDEYDLVHIQNSTLIPMDEIATRSHELADHQSAKIIVYCHMGVRSQMVSRWLRENGFPNAQSLAGGIDAWSTQIDSSLPRY